MASGAPSAAEYGPRPGVLAPLPMAARGVASVLHTSADGKYIAYGNETNVIVRSIEVGSLTRGASSAPSRHRSRRALYGPRKRLGLHVVFDPSCTGRVSRCRPAGMPVNHT